MTALSQLQRWAPNASNSLLSRRYDQLLRSEKFYDCIFHLGDGHYIKCHKLILSSSSPVFEAMFYGPLKEPSSEIEIHDISVDVFRLFTKYIYSGELDFEPLSLEQCIELYYAAEKYLITELSCDSLAALALKLRFSNILPALELSVCMDLCELRNTCLNFFVRTCLGDPQYVSYLKANYVHISKQCMKTIIAACNELQGSETYKHNLICFVQQWCTQEDNERQTELQHEMMLEQQASQLKPMPTAPCLTVERSYYKACRPFMIDFDCQQWRFALKSNRYINLKGLILSSRLTPQLALHSVFTDEYNENLSIEIRLANDNTALHCCAQSEASDSENESEDIEHQQAHSEHEQVLWQHKVCMQPTKYNCDLNIKWNQGIILSPDKLYEVCLSWPSNAYGAEYPCSLQSNCVDGIEFIEPAASIMGSLIKGLRIENLV